MFIESVLVRLTVGALAISVGASFAQSFDAQSRTVSVTPSGSDDSSAIASAFEICLAVGPGCTVQLSEGTFFTRQQDVAGFHGSFAGAGMEATVIEPITPYRVSPERVDVSTRPPDPGAAPVMFTFRDADVTMRDVGFLVRDPAPSEPWYFGDLEIRALAVILSFEGEHTRVDVERLAVEAGPGVTFGASVFNGVYVLPGPSGGDVPMVARMHVRDSRISGPLSGIALGDLEASTVIVRDSLVEAGMAIEIANVASSLIELTGNELAGDEPGVVAQMVTQGRSLSGPTALVMTGNTVRVGPGDRSVGVFLWDEGTPPSQQAFVSGNRFELDGSLAAVHGDADGAVVRDNVVTGRAVSGIRVGGNSPHSGGGVARPWLVVGNDLSELEASYVGSVGILVTHRSRGGVVVCAGPTTVRDGGSTTVLLGCD